MKFEAFVGTLGDDLGKPNEQRVLEALRAQMRGTRRGRISSLSMEDHIHREQLVRVRRLQRLDHPDVRPLEGTCMKHSRLRTQTQEKKDLDRLWVQLGRVTPLHGLVVSMS